MKKLSNISSSLKDDGYFDTKVHIFLEKKACNHRFACNLSKFYLKSHLCDTKVTIIEVF